MARMSRSGYTGNSYVLRRTALHVDNSPQQMEDEIRQLREINKEKDKDEIRQLRETNKEKDKEVTSVFRSDTV